MWDKVGTFIREVRGEFARVSWPTRQELISSTGIVLFFSVILAAFIGVFDLLISSVWKLLLGS